MFLSDERLLASPYLINNRGLKRNFSVMSSECASETSEDGELSRRMATLSPGPSALRRSPTLVSRKSNLDWFPLSTSKRQKRRRIIPGAEADRVTEREVVFESKGCLRCEFHSEFPMLLSELIASESNAPLPSVLPLQTQLSVESMRLKTTLNGWCIALINERVVFYWNLRGPKCRFSERAAECWCIDLSLMSHVFNNKDLSSLSEENIAHCPRVCLSQMDLLFNEDDNRANQPEESVLRATMVGSTEDQTVSHRKPVCLVYLMSHPTFDDDGRYIYTVQHCQQFRNTRLVLSEHLSRDSFGLLKYLSDSLVNRKQLNLALSVPLRLPGCLARTEFVTCFTLVPCWNCLILSTSFGRILYCGIDIEKEDLRSDDPRVESNAEDLRSSRIDVFSKPVVTVTISEPFPLRLTIPPGIHEQWQCEKRVKSSQTSLLGGLFSRVLSAVGYGSSDVPKVEDTFGFVFRFTEDLDLSDVDDESTTDSDLKDEGSDGETLTDTDDDGTIHFSAKGQSRLNKLKAMMKSSNPFSRSAIDMHALNLIRIHTSCYLRSSEDGNNNELCEVARYYGVGSHRLGAGHPYLGITDVVSVLDYRDEYLRLYVLRSAGCIDCLVFPAANKAGFDCVTHSVTVDWSYSIDFTMFYPAMLDQEEREDLKQAQNLEKGELMPRAVRMSLVDSHTLLVLFVNVNSCRSPSMILCEFRLSKEAVHSVPKHRRRETGRMIDNFDDSLGDDCNNNMDDDEEIMEMVCMTNIKLPDSMDHLANIEHTLKLNHFGSNPRCTFAVVLCTEFLCLIPLSTVCDSHLPPAFKECNFRVYSMADLYGIIPDRLRRMFFGQTMSPLSRKIFGYGFCESKNGRDVFCMNDKFDVTVIKSLAEGSDLRVEMKAVIEGVFSDNESNNDDGSKSQNESNHWERRTTLRKALNAKLRVAFTEWNTSISGMKRTRRILSSVMNRSLLQSDDTVDLTRELVDSQPKRRERDRWIGIYDEMVGTELMKMSEAILNSDVQSSDKEENPSPLSVQSESQYSEMNALSGRKQLEMKRDTWIRLMTMLCDDNDGSSNDSLWKNTRFWNGHLNRRGVIVQHRELLEACMALFDFLSNEFEENRRLMTKKISDEIDADESIMRMKKLISRVRCAFLRAVVECVLTNNSVTFSELCNEDDSFNNERLWDWQTEVLDKLFIRCAQINTVHRYSESVSKVMVNRVLQPSQSADSSQQSRQLSKNSDSIESIVRKHLLISGVITKKLLSDELVQCQSEVLSTALSLASVMLGRSLCQCRAKQGSSVTLVTSTAVAADVQEYDESAARMGSSLSNEYYGEVDPQYLEKHGWNRQISLRNSLKTLVQAVMHHCSELQSEMDEWLSDDADGRGGSSVSLRKRSICNQIRMLSEKLLKLLNIVLEECVSKDSDDFVSLRDYVGSSLFRSRRAMLANGDGKQKKNQSELSELCAYLFRAMDVFALRFRDIKLLALLSSELRRCDTERFSVVYCRNLCRFGYQYHRSLCEICQSMEDTLVEQKKQKDESSKESLKVYRRKLMSRHWLFLDVVSSKTYESVKRNIHEFSWNGVGEQRSDESSSSMELMTCELGTFIHECIERYLSEMRRKSKSINGDVLRLSWLHAAHVDKFNEAGNHLQKCGRLCRSSVQLSLAKLCRVAHNKVDPVSLTIDTDENEAWMSKIEHDICVARLQEALGIKSKNPCKLVTRFLDSGMVLDVDSAHLCLSSLVYCAKKESILLENQTDLCLRLLCALLFDLSDWSEQWSVLVQGYSVGVDTDDKHAELMLTSTVFSQFTSRVWMSSETRSRMWQTWNDTIQLFLAGECTDPKYTPLMTDSLNYFLTRALSLSLG